LSATKIKSDLLSYARSLGFERAGITSSQPLDRDESFLKNWLAQGRAGEMDYLERDPAKRARPEEHLEGAKSVIALAMSYSLTFTSSPAVAGRGSMDSPPEAAGNDKMEGKVSRYAQGRDYHKVIGKRLDAFVRYLEAMAPGTECRTFVDTGPLLERSVAQRAGLGFIGKNTMLITKGLGSWVFLANVITTLDLPADAPDTRSCGSCRICIDACPTGALDEPYQMDARRCIAYLTIEQKNIIPHRLAEHLQGWVFGCDICQEVCPHNTLRDSQQRHSGMRMRLSEILSLGDEEEFRSKFAGTAFMRAGRAGLLRNACVAAANLERRDLIPRLEALSRGDPHAVVREEATWALQRLR
jgi:epoxyqueuosine reductase